MSRSLLGITVVVLLAVTDSFARSAFNPFRSSSPAVMSRCHST